LAQARNIIGVQGAGGQRGKAIVTALAGCIKSHH